MNFIVLLCPECQNEPIVIQTDWGTAKSWQGMVVCSPCGEKMRSRWQAGAGGVVEFGAMKELRND